MKKIGIVFVFLLIFSQVAFAEENHGFYVGISGGYVIPQTMKISDPDSGATYTDANLKIGYLAGVKAGWLTPFTKRIMALEMEYNYIDTDFDNGKVIYLNAPGMNGNGTFDGSLRVHALLFNVKARYPEGRIHPYVGAGAGWSYIEVGDITATAADGSGSEILAGDSGNGFCWQLLAGVDFDITPNLGVGIGYKYFATKPTIGSADSDKMYADADYRASVVTVGLTYTF